MKLMLSATTAAVAMAAVLMTGAAATTLEPPRPATAQPQTAGPAIVDETRMQTEVRAMFEHVVAIPTVLGRNRVPEMAEYLAGIYRQAGIPDSDIHIMRHDDTAALIVRWRAENPTQRPIMVMGHMDVVEALPSDWSIEPFQLTERDGYYYGRGTVDMKDGIVGVTQAIIEMRRAGVRPNRDIIIFFTGDEETSGRSAELGATEWRNLIDPEFGLNADGGGGGYTENDRPIGYTLQTAEKTYADYTLTVRNRGGHSSKPRPDNAIYQLANALHRLETYRFTPVLNETTRAYFEARQRQENNALGDAMRRWLANPADGAAADIIEADEGEVGLTRTRCVATQLAGGHAPNALPQQATANVNCRIMPGVDPNAIADELRRIVNDEGVVVTRNDAYVSSLNSPLRADIVNAYTNAVRALHPGMPIMPEMSTGASDARPFREAGIPVYGVNGSWARVPTDLRAHGRDERLPVRALTDNVRHWMMMLSELSSGSGSAGGNASGNAGTSSY